MWRKEERAFKIYLQCIYCTISILSFLGVERTLKKVEAA